MKGSLRPAAALLLAAALAGPQIANQPVQRQHNAVRSQEQRQQEALPSPQVGIHSMRFVAHRGRWYVSEVREPIWIGRLRDSGYRPRPVSRRGR